MEFYPGFEVKRKVRKRRENMSDSVTKYEETEETKSCSGLGKWTQTNTNEIMTKNIDVKAIIVNQRQIFRKLLTEFEYWEESWKHYKNNPDFIEKPLNADEFAQDLANRYEIEEL